MIIDNCYNFISYYYFLLLFNIMLPLWKIDRHFKFNVRRSRLSAEVNTVRVKQTWHCHHSNYPLSKRKKKQADESSELRITIVASYW